MKAYDNREDQYSTTGIDRKTAEQEVPAMFPENPFAEVAYEWNNALRIAIDKMWGE